MDEYANVSVDFFFLFFCSLILSHITVILFIFHAFFFEAFLQNFFVVHTMTLLNLSTASSKPLFKGSIEISHSLILASNSSAIVGFCSFPMLHLILSHLLVQCFSSTRFSFL